MKKHNKKFTPLHMMLLLLVFLTSSLYAFSLKSFFSPYQQPYPAAKFHGIKRTSATSTDQTSEKGPNVVKVGIFVLHVGKYDLQSASMRMDFYVIFRCKPLCKKINFEIMNATSSNIQLAVAQDDYMVYRVQAELNKSNNLRNYPFDHHCLDIILENRQLTSNEMIFEVDPSITALDTGLDVVGFKMLRTWTAKVTNHYYKVFNETYSRYKFSMYIERPWLAGILKGILPALIIICCSFLALFMRIDHLSQRIGIATSTLIASEVFHLNLTASLPPLGYVTFADMFMFINYIGLLMVLLEVILTTHYIDSEHHPMAEMINRHCAWAIPATWLLLQLINWGLFVSTTC